MKLALGTAQFGMDYGVSNSEGRTSQDDVAAILSRAREVGVSVIDTAPAYGDAQSVLGAAMAAVGPFRLVTKTPPGVTESGVVRSALDASLRDLGQTRVYGLLAHSAADLLGANGRELFDAMRSARDEGLVERIGVSVYTPVQAEEALERFGITLIQLPVSLADQRFAASGVLSRLADAGVEIHARSVFLQGALLMPADRLPVHLHGLRSVLDHIDATAAGLSVSRQALAFAFVAGMEEISHVVVGVTDAAQFEDLIGVASVRLPAGFDAGDIAVHDLPLIDPSMWPSRGAS